METQIVNKKRTLKDDPQYFGTYLNMARHNIFLIENHIAQKFEKNKLGVVKSDEHIASRQFFDAAFKNNKLANSKQIFNAFTRFIHVAKIFDNDLLPKSEKQEEGFQQDSIDFNLLSETFFSCFKELNQFRNNFSHYYHIENEEKRNLFVSETLKYFVIKAYEKAIAYAEQRFKDVFKHEHFNIARNKKLFTLHQEFTRDGLVFFCCLFLEKEYAFHFINKIIGFKDTRTAEFKATREVFSVFCVTLPHNRFISEDPAQAYILDALNYLHRCPTELYNNLSEDAKKHFQPTLSYEAVQNIQGSSVNNEQLPIEDFDDYIQSITTQKRNTDRFPFFALKYLDNKESFKPLFHLHLGKLLLKSYKKNLLGNEEDRFIVESFTTFGTLENFQLSNIEEENKEEKVREITQLKKEITIEQYAPKYHIANNKIALNLSNNKYYNGNFLSFHPEVFLSIHELPKVALLEHLLPGKATQLIENFVNLNSSHILNSQFIEEVKSKLTFTRPLKKQFHKDKLTIYNYTLQQLNNKINEIIQFIDDNKEHADDETKNQIKNKKSELKNLYYNRYVVQVVDRKQQLDAILKTYNLNHKQIPERIINYWLQIKEVKDDTTLKNKIKAEKEECKQRLKDLANLKGPKIGEMATFLAKDIIHLVIDLQVKKKITTFYYDRLQECLALYADIEKQQTFKRICSELGLLDALKGHPFLNQIILGNYSKTKDFYRAYLQQKGTNTIEKYDYNRKKIVESNWMYTTFYNVENKQTIISIPNNKPVPYSYKQWQAPQTDFNKWLSNTSKGIDKQQPKPIDLPTNLFDETLNSALQQKLQNPLPNEKANYTALLKAWMPQSQPFYNMPRSYMVYDNEVNFTPGTQATYKGYFEKTIQKVLRQKNEQIKKDNLKAIKKKPFYTASQILAVCNNAITENEKLIRFYETKDRILLLIVQELSGMQMCLQKMDIKSQQSPLNEIIEIKEVIHQKTITAQRKRKDYTILKKLEKDKRLPNLLQYFDEDTIPFDTINKELFHYNQSREKIFDSSFLLEKTIVEKLQQNQSMHILTTMQEEKNKKEGTDVKNIQFDIYTQWLQENKFISQTEADFLLTVRNKFSHNQFPEKIKIEKEVTFDENQNKASQICENYHKKIQAIIAQLN